MLVDSVLNGREIRLGDGSFSDGQGQHSHYIAKRMRGRQQKMKKNEKNFVAGIWTGNWPDFGLK